MRGAAFAWSPVVLSSAVVSRIGCLPWRAGAYDAILGSPALRACLLHGRSNSCTHMVPVLASYSSTAAVMLCNAVAC
jgi:hypothetical protein